jgi:predicted RNA-binding Zn-ribbon protein involved in translation (DUF1610 family)
VRTRYSDPEVFELRCSGCGYAVTDLARVAEACPECGLALPHNWRALEARAMSAEGRRRVAIGLFLFLPLLWIPALVVLAMMDVPALIVIVAGIAVGLQFGAAALAAWPTRAGYETGTAILSLIKAAVATLALAGVVFAAVYLGAAVL